MIGVLRIFPFLQDCGDLGSSVLILGRGQKIYSSKRPSRSFSPEKPVVVLFVSPIDLQAWREVRSSHRVRPGKSAPRALGWKRWCFGKHAISVCICRRPSDRHSGWSDGQAAGERRLDISVRITDATRGHPRSRGCPRVRRARQ